jgi:hypothetical protein
VKSQNFKIKKAFLRRAYLLPLGIIPHLKMMTFPLPLLLSL